MLRSCLWRSNWFATLYCLGQWWWISQCITYFVYLHFQWITFGWKQFKQLVIFESNYKKPFALRGRFWSWKLISKFPNIEVMKCVSLKTFSVCFLSLQWFPFYWKQFEQVDILESNYIEHVALWSRFGP